MKEEIWKPIENYEDYHISNHGRVKSFKQYKDGIILKQHRDKIGYLDVGLYKNKNGKCYRIHCLVANAFIHNPKPKEYIQVNHIDENKSNNYVDNLEWSTCQYNTEYSQSKFYRILFPDGHEEIIFNLAKFCRNNNLNRGNMNTTFKKDCTHKKYKILEIIDQK